MRIQNPFWAKAQDGIPIRFQSGIVAIGGKVFHRFQVPDKAIPVIKDEGNAVPAVAGRGDDLPGYPDACQKCPVFTTADELGFRFVNGDEIQGFFTGKDRIGIMDILHLRVHQQEFDSLLHQFGNQPHVVRVVMRGRTSRCSGLCGSAVSSVRGGR